MADNPPVSTTVPETVTVDTGVDKQSLGNLNADFADFWKETDSKEGAQAEAPPAPGEGAAQETKPETTDGPRGTKGVQVPPGEAPPETKPETITAPQPKEISDDEIDRMELVPRPHTKPELVEQFSEQFRNVKNLWKADRIRAKTETERAIKLQADLEEARRNSLTPEVKADYEHAASIRRKFDFVSDPEFIQKFHQPVRSQFEAILQEAVQVLPERQSAEAWAKHIAENYSPDQLDRNWWLNSVIAKVPNELDRSSLLNSVTQLLKIQRERDTEITRRTNDKSSFDNWIQEKATTTQQRVQQEIMTEIGIQEKRIQEVLPRDAASAKTNEERQAIDKHNERFGKLNTFFQETMKDISANGPRAWVRASVEATRAMLLEGEYKALESELKSTKAERDQYKSELDKITGARRKISQTSGTPPSTPKKSTADGLSVKNLDVRESFKNFDWGDGS